MRLAAFCALLFALLTGAPDAGAADSGQLFVEWHGSWWPAHVVKRTNDGRALIHYDSWGDAWDETVGSSRMTHPVEDGKLFVEWHGSYWPARIVSAPGERAIRVHYEGWGDAWDETVAPSRLIHFPLR